MKLAAAIAALWLVDWLTTQVQLWNLRRSICNMEQNLTQALADLNTKTDQLIGITEAALANGDTTAAVAAVQAVTAKIDAEIAKATPPVTP